MTNFAGNLKSVQLYQDVVKAAIDEAKADKLRAFFASMKNPHLELQEELKLDAENIQKYRNTMKKSSKILTVMFLRCDCTWTNARTWKAISWHLNQLRTL